MVSSFYDCNECLVFTCWTDFQYSSWQNSGLSQLFWHWCKTQFLFWQPPHHLATLSPQTLVPCPLRRWKCGCGSVVEFSWCWHLWGLQPISEKSLIFRVYLRRHLVYFNQVVPNPMDLDWSPIIKVLSLLLWIPNVRLGNTERLKTLYITSETSKPQNKWAEDAWCFTKPLA